MQKVRCDHLDKSDVSDDAMNLLFVKNIVEMKEIFNTPDRNSELTSQRGKTISDRRGSSVNRDSY